MQTFYGEINGVMLGAQRGNIMHGNLSWNGLFIPDGREKTFGEMPMEQHAEMSHRHHAFAAWLDVVLPQ